MFTVTSIWVTTSATWLTVIQRILFIMTRFVTAKFFITSGEDAQCKITLNLHSLQQQFSLTATNNMSRLMTKPTKWHVHPANSQISLGIRPVWSESSLSAWGKLGSLATHWVHREDWSDWADAQADLSLHWAHSQFVEPAHIDVKRVDCTMNIAVQYEPSHEKICLRSFRPVKTQTGLLSCRD